MTVSAIRHGRRLILLLRGDLDMASAPGTLAGIDQLMAEEIPNRLVIDLSRVAFLDSSGLAVLADAVKQGRRHGFDVVVTGLSARHRHLLEVVRMAELFLEE